MVVQGQVNEVPFILCVSIKMQTGQKDGPAGTGGRRQQIAHLTVQGVGNENCSFLKNDYHNDDIRACY